jgi:glycosyltransferase involved in cell wall biosynthesis
MGFRGRLEIIPNGVDVAKFSRPVDAESLHALKRKIGKTDDETYLITSSRLVAKNAVDDVIRSLTLLPDSVKFLVLGTGPDQTALMSLAADLGVEERVIFCGHAEHTDIPAYLAASDIFIRPSLSEGMGNSFIEAMAAGIPVIATQEGGIADFLFDPVKNPEREPTGRAVSPRNPGEIAAAVRAYLENPATTLVIVNNARELVKNRYQWDMVARSMRERVFQTIDEEKR